MFCFCRSIDDDTAGDYIFNFFVPKTEQRQREHNAYWDQKWKNFWPNAVDILVKVYHQSLCNLLSIPYCSVSKYKLSFNAIMSSWTLTRYLIAYRQLPSAVLNGVTTVMTAVSALQVKIPRQIKSMTWKNFILTFSITAAVEHGWNRRGTIKTNGRSTTTNKCHLADATKQAKTFKAKTFESKTFESKTFVAKTFEPKTFEAKTFQAVHSKTKTRASFIRVWLRLGWIWQWLWFLWIRRNRRRLSRLLRRRVRRCRQRVKSLMQSGRPPTLPSSAGKIKRKL